MENLPDEVVSEIARRIDTTWDKNAFSLVSRRLCNIDAEYRDFLRVGRRLHPATEALTSLCIRFRNLSRIEIVYSGWMSNMGRQLDNEGLLVLSLYCPKIVDLTLSFCSFIDDIGLGRIAFCKSLRALKLNFLPGISSDGLLWVGIGCKNLSALHLSRCMKVNNLEWLEYFGKHGELEFLSIKNCRGIGQDDLVILGAGWKNLRHLEFELDTKYKNYNIYGQWVVSKWKRHELCCDKLRELSLVNCSLDSARPLSYILGRCTALENLSLDMCSGLVDSSMSALSQKSCNLKRISLNLSKGFMVSINGDFRLTDSGLKELAHCCSMLEEFELSFSELQFPFYPGLTQDSILSLVQSCPLRVLVLNNACFFNDAGMDALRAAHFLQLLKLVRCQGVTDEGIHHVMFFPSLRTLKLLMCLGVSDAGLKPLVESTKLDALVVKDCPLISEDVAKYAAMNVKYRQDLAWIY